MQQKTIHTLTSGRYVLRNAQVEVWIESGRSTKVMQLGCQRVILSRVLLCDDHRSWQVSYALGGKIYTDILQAAT